MNNLEQAKMGRNEGIATFTNDNASAYATDPAMKALVTRFLKNKKSVTDDAGLMTADNSGFSQMKVDAKLDAADFAATLCGAAQVKLDEIGRHDVSTLLHDAVSYYTAPADADAATRLQAVHDVMAANQAVITDDYVKVAELASLQTLINTFTTTQGTSQAVHSTTPAVTASFKSNIKLTDADAKDFKKLARKYKVSNKTFYDGIVAVCKTPTVAVQHTNVDITVTETITNTPIVGAIATLSNSKKTAASIANGFAHFEQVGGGNVTLNVTATGYKPFAMLVHINAGRDNSFTVALEKI